VSVVLSIVLVALLSAAVLWVVHGEQEKPTSAPAQPIPPVAAPPPSAPAPPHQPATSRRRPPPVAVPATVETARATVTVGRVGAPLPRHRIRSTALLVLLVVVLGIAVALVIGAIVAALAFGVRSAVTS
jgi:hypothetical protein